MLYSYAFGPITITDALPAQIHLSFESYLSKSKACICAWHKDARRKLHCSDLQTFTVRVEFSAQGDLWVSKKPLAKLIDPIVLAVKGRRILKYAPGNYRAVYALIIVPFKSNLRRRIESTVRRKFKAAGYNVGAE